MKYKEEALEQKQQIEKKNMKTKIEIEFDLLKKEREELYNMYFCLR